MQSLEQLESKILDLQSQIQAIQAQIADYQNNPAYIDFYYTCIVCSKNTGKIKASPCHIINGKLHTFFTKTAELAQAQAQLTTLQNELNATQEQYELEKEQRKNRALILYQAFLLTIPPTKTQSTQKVLKSIESLQSFLKQDVERQYL